MSFADAMHALYNVETDLRIVAQAIDGTQITGVPVDKLGASSLLERIAEVVGQSIEALEQDATKRARALGSGC